MYPQILIPPQPIPTPLKIIETDVLHLNGTAQVSPRTEIKLVLD